MMIHRVEHNRRRLPMEVCVCESRAERGRGLLLRRCPDARTAFLLRPCSAIHTFGMTFPIDVLFCDADGRIVKIVERIPPWRMARHPGACCAWELRGGGVALWGWQLGDRIRPC
ncbi:MAG: DUF192 domain-containing protein [Steroidobacteraceae bacterium]